MNTSVESPRAVLPNHSLNRTHCGMRPKARHFILGFSPHTATVRLAQTLGVRTQAMRSLWNTFNAKAAWLACALALCVSCYVSNTLQDGYRYSAWWSAALHSPFFAFGLYVYLSISFNIVHQLHSWTRAFTLAAWLAIGSIVPSLIGYGFVLLTTFFGYIVPAASYLPIGLGSLDVAVHITWLGFILALIGSIVLVDTEMRASSVIATRTDA